MRRLMWFAVGFAAACAAGAYLVSGNWLLLLALFCLAAVIALLFVKTKYGKIARIAMIGCLIGFLWFWVFDTQHLANARAYDAQTIETTIEISDYSTDTDYGIAAAGKLVLDGKTYRVKAYLYRNETLQPGDQVAGEIRLRYTSDGGEEEPTFHRGNGIFFLAYCDEDAQIIHADKVPYKYAAACLRHKIIELLNAVFPADTLAFARALLLGDTGLLSYETDTQLSVSGIRHVVAVSGLHVSILFSLLLWVFGERRFLTPIIGIAVLVVFAAVAGFTPSVVRACMMQGLMLLSMIFLTEYDSPTALAFSVLVMLAVNPLAITSVSLQLSAGSIIGIQLFSRKIHDYLLNEKRMGPAKGKTVRAKLTRWFVSSVSITLSAMTVTTPLSACYFGSVSLIGVLTNLLTLWVVTFIFQGIMVACVAGAIWLPLGKCIAWLISWPIRYVLYAAKMLSSFPMAAVYTKSVYIVMWLIFCYVLFAVFLLSKKKHPMVMGICLTVGLFIALAVSWLEPRLDSYRVSILDVGQGQCILLQNHDAFYLVDCGGDSDDVAADTAAELLLSQGIRKLDGLILTHYDLDHAGAVENLLSRIPADTLYLQDMPDPGNLKEQFSVSYSDSICWIEENTVYTIENAGITLCSGEYTKSDNESSLCVLFQPENCDILITGDRSDTGEKVLLEQIALPDLEILVVGHHGANSSTCIELLHATRPDIAVISVGERNNYGHPAQDVLQRLEMFECEVFRTDISGTIIFRG